MARTKRTQPPFVRSEDGKTDNHNTIVVAYYWPNEGYGCGTKFDSRDAALAFARNEAAGVEASNVRAEIHIIETTTRTTVVRAA